MFTQHFCPFENASRVERVCGRKITGWRFNKNGVAAAIFNWFCLFASFHC